MSRYHLDAYSAIDRARAELTAFVRSSFRFQSPVLDERVHRLIDQFGLVAPSVVEATFPYEEPTEGPRTTAELAAAGLVHSDLVSILANASGEACWPATRALYKHQVEAVRAYKEGKSVVVASGTGSGKTECFLFPAIDKVLRDGDLDSPGVRVLIVYPLNALVNNQMDRLRALLGHHSKIRFALYTRRLEHTEKTAVRKLERSGQARLPAEIISRERLRESPPHILITNFSMLEYALVRPADAPIFSSQFSSPKLLILDEAHVYAGAMAAEITMLLRRAWLRWGLDPHTVQGIVTSATMHQGVEGGPELLRKFSGDILSKTPSSVIAIEGSRIMPPDNGVDIDIAIPAPPTIAALCTDFPTLRADRTDDGSIVHVFDANPESLAAARAVVACLRPGFTAAGASLPAGPLLHEALEPLAWVRHLRRKLHEDRLRVDHLANDLFGPGTGEATRRRAVHKLLEVLSLARSAPEALPLLPVRLHAIVRGPHGIYACIDGTCKEASIPGRLGALYTDPVERCGCGAVVCELRVCEGCGQAFLLGERIADEETGVARLQHVGPRIPELLVPGHEWDDGRAFESEQRVNILPDGRIVADQGIAFAAFPGGRVVGATRQLVSVKCPCCDLARPMSAVIRKVEVGTDAALQVTLDGLYPALPEHSASDDRHLPGRGRRALLFADNRQVAAALAAKIEDSHDLLLSRAILLDAVADASKAGGSPRLDQLRRELDIAMARDDADGEAEESRLRLEIKREMRETKGGAVPFPKLVTEVARHPNLRELSCWRPDAVDDLARLIVTRELARRPARVGNLEASGLLVIEYLLKVLPASDPDVAHAFQSDAWSSLIAVLLDMLRTGGLVSLPALGGYDSYVAKERYDKSLVRTGKSFEPGDDDDAPTGGDRLTLVAAADRTSRRTDYLGRVLQLLAVPARVTPALVLEQVWIALVAAAKIDPSSLLAVGDDALTLPMTLLRFRDGASGARWRCRRCATVWARQVANVCPTRHCNGTLESMTVGELDMRDRLTVLASQRSTTPLLGMRTEEHTAQIGVDELADIETAFKKGDVNILVCSTTMELGIDIGGLSASVLTNVPPGASNYLQRAGRAGRRAEGTSLVLTFARPRPFDQAVFEEPEKPFRDRIVPPSVKLDSRRIVQRHSSAFLLSTFFRRYRAQADARDPMSSLRNVREFFDKPLKDVLLALGTPPFEALGIDVAHEALADAFVVWLGGPVLADSSLAAELRSLLVGTVLDTVDAETLAGRAADQMRSVITNVRDQLAYLRGERRDEEAKPESERDSGKLCAIEYQENDLLDEKLLGYLAEEQFLPRYGFPVHVVPLRHAWEKERNVAGKFVREDDDGKLRLQRDVALALNEYAPGAEVVAAKHVYASRGILRHWTGADAPGVLASRFLAVCPGCGGLQYARTEGEVRNPCPTCKEEAPRTISVVFPKHGFAVKWGEIPRRWTSGSRMPLRPVTEASYAARTGESVVQVSSALWLAYDEEGQIVVRTEGDLAEADLAVGAHGSPGMPREGYGYAICYLCGRAEPEMDHAPTGADRGKADPLPRALVGHNRLRGYKKCEAAHQYWRHMALAGGVRTETLRFQLRGPAELPPGPMGRRLATTWMVALQLSGGETLGIDSRSIGGLLEPRPRAMGSVVYDVILYDQVAGGAGHCRALLDRWTELLDNVRTRLFCPNAKCTNGCHRCLIAFETQRYEDLLRRADLKMFLEDKWEPLKQRTARDGRSVAPLFRGGTQLREALARNRTSRVIVSIGSIADDALVEDGWLRVLLRHADGGGRVVLVTEKVPNPDDDGERFIAERLRIAVADGRVELRKAAKGAAAMFPWRVVVPDVPSAYFVEGESAAVGLGPDWTDAGLFEAEPSAAPELCQRGENLAGDATVVTAAALAAKPPPPSVIVRYVPPNEPPVRSGFDHWFRAPSGESLFQRPLAELTIIDPYVATEWQLRLLAELVQLAQKGGCKKVKVETYPPERQKEDSGPGVHRTVRANEQQEFLAKLLGDKTWRPVADPGRGLRKHKRLVKGVRDDGTRFEVLLERGIDFLTERRVGRGTERTTRETFVVVRDPG